MFKNLVWDEVSEDARLAGSRKMTGLMRRELSFVFLLVTTLCFGFASSADFAEAASYSVETGEFRWTKSPLNVYVETNEWSKPDYVLAVREALDNWVKSVWNYSHTYNDSPLNMMNYVFYVSGVNATGEYDVYLSFVEDYIPAGPNTVGLTTYYWDRFSHDPISPIVINVTTFSRTATSLFVKNVAMHEFGHALGLGHALSSSTLNGPELMYFSSSKNQVVYPSTLDVYGLTRVYSGDFGDLVQLPSDIPYVMLAEGAVPVPQPSLLEDYRQYFPLLAIVLVVVIAVAVLSQLTGGKKRDELVPEPPPPPVPPSLNGQCGLG